MNFCPLDRDINTDTTYYPLRPWQIEQEGGRERRRNVISYISVATAAADDNFARNSPNANFAGNRKASDKKEVKNVAANKFSNCNDYPGNPPTDVVEPSSSSFPFSLTVLSSHS